MSDSLKSLLPGSGAPAGEELVQAREFDITQVSKKLTVAIPVVLTAVVGGLKAIGVEQATESAIRRGRTRGYGVGALSPWRRLGGRHPRACIRRSRSIAIDRTIVDPDSHGRDDRLTKERVERDDKLEKERQERLDRLSRERQDREDRLEKERLDVRTA